MIYPNDDTGDALRRLEAGGDDLTHPRDIDFTVVFPNEDAASHFADHFRKLGYAVSFELSEVQEGFPWDVNVVQQMAPSYEAIASFEDELQHIADTLGGKNDGWGCISQPSRILSK